MYSIIFRWLIDKTWAPVWTMSSNHYTPAMCNHYLRRSRHPLFHRPINAAWNSVSEIFSIWGLCRCIFFSLTSSSWQTPIRTVMNHQGSSRRWGKRLLRVAGQVARTMWPTISAEEDPLLEGVAQKSTNYSCSSRHSSCFSNSTWLRCSAFFIRPVQIVWAQVSADLWKFLWPSAPPCDPRDHAVPGSSSPW